MAASLPLYGNIGPSLPASQVPDNSQPTMSVPTHTTTIGILQPPPEIRNYIDQLVILLAHMGPVREKTFKENNAKKDFYSFLNDSHPFNPYFQHQLSERIKVVQLEKEAAKLYDAIKSESDKKLERKAKPPVKKSFWFFQPPPTPPMNSAVKTPTTPRKNSFWFSQNPPPPPGYHHTPFSGPGIFANLSINKIRQPPLPPFQTPPLLPNLQRVDDSRLIPEAKRQRVHGTCLIPGEPEPKRQRPDVSCLIPAHCFLAQHPGPARIMVAVPSVDEGNLKGQLLGIMVRSFSETIGSLKEKIAGEVQLPVNKQKLMRQAAFLKDNMSLAEYNIAAGETLTLVVA